MSDVRYQFTADDKGVGATLSALDKRFGAVATGGIGRGVKSLVQLGGAAVAGRLALGALGNTSDQAGEKLEQFSKGMAELVGNLVGGLAGALSGSTMAWDKWGDNILAVHSKVVDSLANVIALASNPELARTMAAQDARGAALKELKDATVPLRMSAAEAEVGAMTGSAEERFNARAAILEARFATERERLEALGKRAGVDVGPQLESVQRRRNAEFRQLNLQYGAEQSAESKADQEFADRQNALAERARAKAEEIADERELVRLRGLGLEGDEAAARLGELRLRQVRRRREIERDADLTPARRLELLEASEGLALAERGGAMAEQLAGLRTGVRTASVGTGMSLSGGMLANSLSIGIDQQQLAKLTGIEQELKQIRGELARPR